jgi:hypothetical protein
MATRPQPPASKKFSLIGDYRRAHKGAQRTSIGVEERRDWRVIRARKTGGPAQA